MGEPLGLPKGSVRAIAFLLLLLSFIYLVTYCVIQKIVDPLQALVVMAGQLGFAMGFYFGSKKNKEVT